MLKDLFKTPDEANIKREMRTCFNGLTLPYSWRPGRAGKVHFEGVTFPLFPDNRTAPSFNPWIKAPRPGSDEEEWINRFGFAESDLDSREILRRFFREHATANEEALRLRGKSRRSWTLRLIARWFQRLRGRRLREILTPDEKSAARWEKNLREEGLTWNTLRIPGAIAARVTGELFKEIRGVEMKTKSLEVELGRLLKPPPPR